MAPAISEEETHDSDEESAKGFAEGFLIAFFNPKLNFPIVSLSQILQPDFTCNKNRYCCSHDHDGVCIP